MTATAAAKYMDKLRAFVSQWVKQGSQLKNVLNQPKRGSRGKVSGKDEKMLLVNQLKANQKIRTLQKFPKVFFVLAKPSQDFLLYHGSPVELGLANTRTPLSVLIQVLTKNIDNIDAYTSLCRQLTECLSEHSGQHG